MECNQITTNLAYLKTKFLTCKVLSASDMQLLVDAVQATYTCGGSGGESGDNLFLKVSLGTYAEGAVVHTLINSLPAFSVNSSQIVIVEGERTITTGAVTPYNRKERYILINKGTANYGVGGVQLIASDLLELNPKQLDYVDMTSLQNIGGSKIFENNITFKQDTLFKGLGTFQDSGWERSIAFGSGTSNYTINLPNKVNGTYTFATVSDIPTLIDDDTFATATASNIASAESIKAYVDANTSGSFVDLSSAQIVGGVKTWQSDATFEGRIVGEGDISGNTLSVTGQYQLPATDGTDGQILTTDGLGVVTWETPESSVLSLASTIVSSGNVLLAHVDGMNEVTSTVTLTIQENATVNIPVGSVITYKQVGASATATIAHAGSVSGNSAGVQTYRDGDVLTIWQKSLDVWEVLNKPDRLDSSTVGEPTGADEVANIVSLTQAEYDAGTPVAGTFYVITA